MPFCLRYSVIKPSVLERLHLCEQVAAAQSHCSSLAANLMESFRGKVLLKYIICRCAHTCKYVACIIWLSAWTSTFLAGVIYLCNGDVPAQLPCHTLSHVLVLYWRVLMKVPSVPFLLFPGSLCLIIILNIYS